MTELCCTWNKGEKRPHLTLLCKCAHDSAVTSEGLWHFAVGCGVSHHHGIAEKINVLKGKRS